MKKKKEEADASVDTMARGFLDHKQSATLSWLCCATICLALVGLAACGGSVPVRPRQSDISQIDLDPFVPGSTPFIGSVRLQGSGIRNLAGYSFSIQPRSGSVSSPVHVTYTMKSLVDRGYVQTDPLSGVAQAMTLPIYGLYAGFTNSVSLDLAFSDGSVREIPLQIMTQPYDDPTEIYAHPIVLKQRSSGDHLGFNFFAIKSALGTPVIADTDGEIRWVSSGVSNSWASVFTVDRFLVGDAVSPVLYQLTLPGTITRNVLQSPTVLAFHHNVDRGKQGFFVEVDTSADVESTLQEITEDGTVLRTWDLGAILSAYMRANGDDPTAFVRPGVDWFHMNSATYDPRDDSVIVSSRENFLIKLDYSTGNIIWIFGDPTKYWYTFPSLRAKAITLQQGGLYPIGQHAVSITSDGFIMVFNDGLGSINEPSGTPAGETRTFSTVSAYSVDPTSLAAEEAWDFDYGESIYSRICSSAYEAPGHSYLVDYAVAGGITARVVGLDLNRTVVFDFQYPTISCSTSWNAVPVPLEDLIVTQ